MVDTRSNFAHAAISVITKKIVGRKRYENCIVLRYLRLHFTFRIFILCVYGVQHGVTTRRTFCDLGEFRCLYSNGEITLGLLHLWHDTWTHLNSWYLNSCIVSIPICLFVSCHLCRITNVFFSQSYIIDTLFMLTLFSELRKLTALKMAWESVGTADFEQTNLAEIRLLLEVRTGCLRNYRKSML